MGCKRTWYSYFWAVRGGTKGTDHRPHYSIVKEQAQRGEKESKESQPYETLEFDSQPDRSTIPNFPILQGAIPQPHKGEGAEPAGAAGASNQLTIIIIA